MSSEAAKGAVRDAVVADLGAETDSLLKLIRDLSPGEWDAPTPAAGWSIRDQVTHLAYFDDATLLAIDDPEAFAQQRGELTALGPGFPDAVAAVYRPWPGQRCLDWFERSRSALLAMYLRTDPAARLPWYGPDMGLASSASGRLMETFAHGQDVADTLGVTREPTARLRHVADIGVRTFGFAFRLRARPVPDAQVRVELAAPGGSSWTWGPADAADVVRGSALDFCLVVTQRRNVADTDLHVGGSTATEWIEIAQAYAGEPSDGRPAGRGSGNLRSADHIAADHVAQVSR
jgi:uncharacterized protein (TIGR03084 family)